MDKLVLVSPAKIGDTLIATPAIRAWRRAHSRGELTVCCPPASPAHDVLLGNPYIDSLRIATADEASALPGEHVVLDPGVALDAAWRNGRPFAWNFGRMLGVEIDSLRYDFAITELERREGEAACRELGLGRPVVVVARHSASCESNVPAIRRANKCIDNFYWALCAEELARRGYVPLAVGSEAELFDARYERWCGERCYGRPLRLIASICAQSAAVLTVDNGIRHLAAAAGANLFALSGEIPLAILACVPVRDGQRIVETFRRPDDVNVRTLPRGVRELGL